MLQMENPLGILSHTSWKAALPIHTLKHLDDRTQYNMMDVYDELTI